MARKDRVRAARLRAQLVSDLGGKCKKCGTTEKLEIDVITPTGCDRHHRKMSSDQRVTFYLRLHKKNKVQLLCKKHNGEKGVEDAQYLQRKKQREDRKKELADVPF